MRSVLSTFFLQPELRFSLDHPELGVKIDPDTKKELDEVPDLDENGDPIFKVEGTDEELEETAIIAEDSEFRDTPQDLKDETSQD